LARHDAFCHDADEILLECGERDLTMNLAVGWVTYGLKSMPRDTRLWTENIHAGAMKCLLIYFLEEVRIYL
jgi:hypothetical protein